MGRGSVSTVSRAIRSAAILCLALLGCAVITRCSGPVPLAEEANAAPDGFQVSIDLVQETLGAQVTGHQHGAATFNGTVTVMELSGRERVLVEISSHCDEGWTTIDSVATMVFIDNGSQPFHITVVVPAATPCDEVGLLTVEAVAESEGIQRTASDTSLVTADQYFKVGAESDVPMYTGEYGGTVTGCLLIHNEGNGADTLAISMETVPEGVVDWMFETNITIQRNSTGRLDFRFTIAEDFGDRFVGARFSIGFMLQSTKAMEKGLDYTKTLQIYIFIEGLEDTFIRNWPALVVSTIVLVASTAVIARFLLLRRRGGGQV